MTVPILFFQTWGKGSINELEYLYVAIAKAHSKNPDSEIYLIGDVPYARTDFVHVVSPSSFSESYLNFIATYNYQHPNSEYWYLAAAIGRIFVIEEFARKKSISTFLYVESDVLVNVSAEDLLDDMGAHLLGYCISESQRLGVFATLLVRDLKLLQSLCKFISEALSGADTQSDTEMRYLYEFYQNNRNCVFNQASISNQHICDFVLTDITSQGVHKAKTRHGKSIKNITIIDRVFYHDDLPYASLHFQGHELKKDMLMNYLASTDTDAIETLQNLNLAMPRNYQYTDSEDLLRQDQLSFLSWIDLTRIYPDYWRPYFEIAKNPRQFSESISSLMYHKLQEILPGPFFIDSFFFGDVLSRKKQFTLAISLFSEKLFLCPCSYPHHEQRLLSLRWSGRKAEALALVDDFIDLFRYRQSAYELVVELFSGDGIPFIGNIRDRGLLLFPYSERLKSLES